MTKSMKRLTAPRSWPVKRKVSVFITKPNPGPHAIDGGMPLALVLRDMLQVCDTAREAKRILGQRDILVDGRVAKDPKLPVGVMDVVSIPRTGNHYRMVLNPKGKLELVRIDADDATWKLCRIENKTMVKGGRVQINLHDGRNLVIDEDDYRTGDVIKLALPEQSVMSRYPLKQGSIALIVSGSHTGETAIVDEYAITRRPSPNIVRFKDGRETVKKNVFVIGDKAPEIKLPEGSAI